MFIKIQKTIRDKKFIILSFTIFHERHFEVVFTPKYTDNQNCIITHLLGSFTDLKMAELSSLYKLPRQIEAHYPDNTLLDELHSRTKKLWEGGTLVLPVLMFSEPLKSALLAARRSGRIVRGLETAAAILNNEGYGIDLLRRDAVQGSRISRVVLLSDDGSGNFYRTVERLLEKHAPRVLGCMLDADSFTLGSLLFGRAAAARLVLVSHKDDVSRLLLALMQQS
jgi:hypothetical protein